MLMILLARVTSFKPGQDVLGFHRWAVAAFLETGILGAIFVVNVGQLSFRMLASSFPVIFVNNYIMYALLEIALAVEATGVFNACWPLSWAVGKLLGLKEDPELPSKAAAAGVSAGSDWGDVNNGAGIASVVSDSGSDKEYTVQLAGSNGTGLTVPLLT